MAATDHAYFWVEAGLAISQSEVIAAAERFEAEFYPQMVHLESYSAGGAFSSRRNGGSVVKGAAGPFSRLSHWLKESF